LKRIRLVVLDDYEGQLAGAPAMSRLRKLAEVVVLDRPLEPLDLTDLKNYQVLIRIQH